MNELRWILAGFGLVLLAVIYAWGRFNREAPPARAERLDLDDDGGPGTAAHVVRDPAPVFDEPIFDEPVYDSPAYERAAREVDVDAVAEEGWATDSALRAEPVFNESSAHFGEATNAPAGRVEPTFSADMDDGVAPSTAEVADDNVVASVADAVQPVVADLVAPSVESTPKPRQPRKIVTLRLAAAPLERYEGARLRALLQTEALQHGKYGIFHSLDNAGNSRFSVASMVEPGTFDMATIDQLEFPGITFFTLLPGPADGVDIFEDMTGCAYRLAQSMGGMLQDERGAPLTQRRYNQLREEVAMFERSVNTGQIGA